MRRGICIGYLLARASDTLADSQKEESWLDAFEGRLQATSSHHTDVKFPSFGSAKEGEKQLLASLPDIFDALESLPPAESTLIRDVVSTIISGQRLDMRRFADASAEQVVSLASADELHDYTWRVAGCVGQFWTRLGFLTLGDAFSQGDPHELESLGIRFGQGLQLVNILRDTGEDLQIGRNYLPSDRAEWMEKARESLQAGLIYASAMRLKRLHIAVSLPARIGIDTLDAIEHAAPPGSGLRVKIPRSRIWWHFAAACKSSLSRGRG